MKEQKKDISQEISVERSAIINDSGKIIVSASAGAGKTAIMIDKICKYIEDGGEIEEILAITYTKKAASELKERLHDKLNEKISEYVSSETLASKGKAENLQKQLDKLPYADIGTIHSFCTKLIRRYYYVLGRKGVDSSFEISTPDDGRAGLLSSKALDDLLESKYGDPDFDFLVGCFSGSDEKLKKAITKGYEKLRYIPDYRTKLKGYADRYTETGFDAVCKMIFDRNKIEYDYDGFLQKYRDFRRDELSFEDESMKISYKKVFDNIETFLNSYFNGGDIFTDAHKHTNVYNVGNLPNIKKAKFSDDKERAERVKDFIKEKNREWTNIKNSFYKKEKKDHERDKFLKSGEVVKQLCKLMLEYDSLFTDAKSGENILDYPDLEHGALEILVKDKKDGVRDGLQDDVVEAIQKKYKYIFVDEYQDVNPVQELILNSLAAEDTNCFYVGDMKQAIYEFRGSNSDFFRSKSDEYKNKDDERYQLRYLTHNFRSAKKIIDAVNEIFGGLNEKNSPEETTYAAMNRSVYGMDYADNDMMVYGGKYADGALGNVEVDYFENPPDVDETDCGLSPYSVKKVAERINEKKHYAHGEAVAAVIDEEIKNGKIYEKDGGGPRDVKYGDICILAKKGVGDTLRLVNYLKEKGYPVSCDKSADVKKECEIRFLLDILSCIDNPEQDVPLCSFLLSPICGLTEKDLAKIRTENTLSAERFNTFVDRVKKYSETVSDDISESIKTAYRKIGDYRDLAEIVGAETLIDKVCEDAGWHLIYEKERGILKKGIRELQNRAYRSDGGMSLSEFMRHIERDEIEVRFPDVAESDCIRVMTIHSAKGLEFPIVILSDVCTSFRGRSNDGSITFDDEFGFAPKWYDSSDMTCGETFVHDWIKEKQKRKDIVNEINLFYVACTRAKYSLHIMNSASCEFSSSPDKIFSALCYAGLVDFDALTGYADNSGYERDTDDDSGAGHKIPYKIIKPGEPNPVVVSGVSDTSLKDELKNAYDKTCSPIHGEDIPMYVLPSDQSEAGEKEDTDEDGKSVRAFVAVPQTKEKGTAYHKFLEVCDFSKKSRSEIEAEVNELDVQTAGLLRDETDNLKDLLSMPVFSDVPGDCYRERKFSCFLSAHDIIDGADSDDEVYVDGVIDFMTVEGDKIRIVDYKYSGRSDEDLRTKYSRQLKIYRLAVFKMFGGKIPMENISTTLINIYTKRVVPLDA